MYAELKQQLIQQELPCSRSEAFGCVYKDSTSILVNPNPLSTKQYYKDYLHEHHWCLSIHTERLTFRSNDVVCSY